MATSGGIIKFWHQFSVMGKKKKIKNSPDIVWKFHLIEVIILSAINEVYKTLIFALILVTIIIYLEFRAIIVPIIALPVFQLSYQYTFSISL